MLGNRDDIIMCVFVGMFAALGFSMFVGVSRIILGPGHIEQLNTNWLELSGAYLLSGLIGGVFVGVLFPLRQHWLGRLLLGFIAALTFYSIVAWTYLNGVSLDTGWVLGIVFISIVTGSGAAIFVGKG